MIRINIKRGLDLSLGEKPESMIEVIPSRVALLGQDFHGLRPQLMVEAGDQVNIGDVLFTNLVYPQVLYTAPAPGIISSISYGARRSLEAVVIDVDRSKSPERTLEDIDFSDLSPEAVRNTLQQSGLWTALRSRPLDRVASPDQSPSQLFVTAMDTNPLSPDPAAIIRERGSEFEQGVKVLSSLCNELFICMAPGANLKSPEGNGIVPVEFDGCHPAGLPGTHIYEIARYRKMSLPSTPVWHIGYQDTITIGKLFLTGKLDRGRIVSIAGPSARHPCLVKTTAGAQLAEMIVEQGDGQTRIISGPVFSGRAVTSSTGFLGHYDNQIILLPDRNKSSSATGGMMAIEAFDRVWPHKVPPTPLLRALLIQDSEALSALGGSLLAPEDMALCSYVCPGRNDYGDALQKTLMDIEKGR